MRLCLLGSGSLGNVAFVEGSNTRVLIDAGLNKKTIVERLGTIERGLGLHRIDAVLVTHNHSDHIGCAPALELPVYATPGTVRTCDLETKCTAPLTTITPSEPFAVGDLNIVPVPLPHDAVDTVGYVVSHGRHKIGVLTDLGYEAEEVAVAYAGCDVLVLETNHDATLLKHGPYPPSLKRRVGGRRGHLSNDQAAQLLRMIMKHGPAPRLTIAAHLSTSNNRPQLARTALSRVLGRSGKLIMAAQNRPTPMIELEGGRIFMHEGKSRQLSFAFADLAPSAEPGRLTS